MLFILLPYNNLSANTMGSGVGEEKKHPAMPLSWALCLLSPCRGTHGSPAWQGGMRGVTGQGDVGLRDIPTPGLQPLAWYCLM